MNPLPAKIIAFALGCSTAAAVWMQVRPKSTSREVAPAEAPPPREVRWKEGDLGPALAAADAAKSPAEKAVAALRLARIPDDQIPAALARATLVENRQLTVAAKTLLVRWGETDGEAAMEWAWERLRGEGLWNRAFHQIGPAWAWTDPEAFGEWVLRSMDHQGPVPGSEGKASDSPQLDFGAISRSCRWLAPEDPLLATRLFKQRGGWSSDDDKFAKCFNTTEQIREALGAFDDLDQLTPWKIQGNQLLAHQLLWHWQKLDPEGFDASRYASALSANASQNIERRTNEWLEAPEGGRSAAADRLLASSEPANRKHQLVELTREWTKSAPRDAAEWIASLPEADRSSALRSHTGVRAAADLPSTMTWIAELPTGEQPLCLTTAFDTWSSNNPGSQPDQSAWREPLRQAWADLEALLPDGSE